MLHFSVLRSPYHLRSLTKYVAFVLWVFSYFRGKTNALEFNIDNNMEFRDMLNSLFLSVSYSLTHTDTRMHISFAEFQ